MWDEGGARWRSGKGIRKESTHSRRRSKGFASQYPRLKTLEDVRPHWRIKGIGHGQGGRRPACATAFGARQGITS